MRTGYHVTHPLRMRLDAAPTDAFDTCVLESGDQIVYDDVIQRMAVYRGGVLVDCIKMSRIGVKAMVGSAILQRT